MHIQQFHIENYKSFQDVTFHFNKDVNVLTGKNNSGKTSVLEAIALWQECFNLLIKQRKITFAPGTLKRGRPKKNEVKKTQINIWLFNDQKKIDNFINVLTPEIKDIFFECEIENDIILCATFNNNEGILLPVGFRISYTGDSYTVEFAEYDGFSREKLNSFFSNLPEPFTIFYAKPTATVNISEPLVTNAKILEACSRQQSITVIRNRINQIAQTETLFDELQRDLSYILLNFKGKIILSATTNQGTNKTVLVTYKFNEYETAKDIILLGSGTLQIIEILINFYHANTIDKEYRLIMLDEPDSFIHRDIQKRLLETITRFSKNSQVIIATHNESFIRSAPLQYLFHLDGRSAAIFKPINETEIERLEPRFKGIYPSLINPIIRSVGEITGIDFINAIECDKLIFVEGENDARYFNVLLKQQIGIGQKNMFWVMGGVNELLEHILAYKTVFSAIKNGKSLWSKCCVIIDKDYLTTDHIEKLANKFKSIHQLELYSFDAYTFEATLLTQMEYLSVLICQWIKLKTEKSIDVNTVYNELGIAYGRMKEVLQSRLNDKFIEDIAHGYRNAREKTNGIFNKTDVVITENDIQLSTLARKYYKNIISEGDYYKLMHKEDVEKVIGECTSQYGINFSIKTDFIELIKLVNKATWIQQWDFLMKI